MSAKFHERQLILKSTFNGDSLKFWYNSRKYANLICLGQRHFDESVTLDSLPLTDPEHFGNNVQAKDMFNSNIFTTDDTTTGTFLLENFKYRGVELIRTELIRTTFG